MTTTHPASRKGSSPDPYAPPARRKAPVLFPYQEDGARFLSRVVNGHLWDDMGVGKTIQAIRAMDRLMIRRFMVFCPSSAKENWRREIEWAGLIPRRIDVAYGRGYRFAPGADVLILNYDLLTGADIARQVRAHRADGVILDEAHFLKNRTAARTRAVFGADCDGLGGLIEHARARFTLTATPAPNHPGEIWTLLHAITPNVLITHPHRPPLPYNAFLGRYCRLREGPYGVKVEGGRNLDDLKARLAPVVLRRRKADVLPQLPPFRAVTVPVSATQAVRAKLAAAQSAQDLTGLQAALAAGDDKAVQAALVRGSTNTSSLQRLTGVLKAPLVADMLRTDLDGGMDKIVVFAIHRDVLQTLYASLGGYGAVVVSGDTSGRDRTEAVDRFQNDPRARLFLGQTIAAGTAITLTAASNLVFAESAWVPADNAQAAMRIHRIGQDRSVLVRLPYIRGSIDEAVMEACRVKLKTISGFLS